MHEIYTLLHMPPCRLSTYTGSQFSLVYRAPFGIPACRSAGLYPLKATARRWADRPSQHRAEGEMAQIPNPSGPPTPLVPSSLESTTPSHLIETPARPAPCLPQRPRPPGLGPFTHGSQAAGAGTRESPVPRAWGPSRGGRAAPRVYRQLHRQRPVLPHFLGCWMGLGSKG